MTNTKQRRTTETKAASMLTFDDLVTVAEFRFPKGAFKGELYDAQENFVANVYLFEGRGYVGEPRAYGRGEVVAMLPGSFDPKQFENIGRFAVSSTRSVRKWRLKDQ